MNHSIYLFGEFSSGYSQYPDDFSKDLFQKTAADLRAKTQLALFREEHLLYYIYLRQLDIPDSPGRYFGMAISFNDIYCDDINGVFSIFEEAITDIVTTGKVLDFTDQGGITTPETKLCLEQTEIERISTAISSALEELPQSSFNNLPPVNYGIGRDESTSYAVSDMTSTILRQSIEIYSQIYIYKNEDYDTLALSGYSGRIRDMSKQIFGLQSANAELIEELARVKRQKKRTTAVTLLSVAVICVFIILLVVGSNLNGQVSSLNSQVDDLEESLRERNITISRLNQDKINLQNSLNNANDQVYELERDNASLKRELDSYRAYYSYW